MKILFVCFSVLVSLLCSAQQVYRCEYSESISLQLSDSGRREMKEKMQTKFLSQGLDSAITEKLIKELPLDNFSNNYTRKMLAEPDSTIIVVQPHEEGGPVRFNLKEERLLIKGGELYKYNFLLGVWLIQEKTKTDRTFSKTGKTRKILDYDCEEQVSDDNTCTVWTTTALPDYINPAIYVGSVRGAILAFELKKEGPIVKSEMKQIKPQPR